VPAPGIRSGGRAVERRVGANLAGGGARAVVPAMSGGSRDRTERNREEACVTEEEEGSQGQKD
jgi:hypothetical protein